MIIIIKDKFKEVFPSKGMLLFLDNEIYEGLCCPLSVDPENLYTEITIEEAEAIMAEQAEEEEINDDN